MFTCGNGEPFHAADVTWWFIQLYEEIGLPPVRLHDLRHGAATPAHAAGTDLKDIQEMLGHSSITITADTYTSLLPEADLAPKAWRPVRSRTAHASGPGRGVRGRIERLPGRETPGRWLNALCPGRIRTCDTRFRSSIVRPLQSPFFSYSYAQWGRSRPTVYAVVDVTWCCQRCSPLCALGMAQRRPHSARQPS
ncbi:tyrosine-type recombinase/integrase [Streptomyces sp. NPDC005571]|uniref:tyrosine-type recombinase/integrase n=1 Tax=Streptomyces sp. NPDC005571 TaxID=3156888 RepID=UPI0033A150FA